MKRFTSILSLSFIVASLSGICQTVSVPSGVVGTSSNSFMGIGTSSPTENLSISSNSNVYMGIHKPSLSYKLTLGIGGHNGILNYTAGSNPSNSKLYFQTNNTSHLLIDDSGNIGIGTATTHNGKLTVNTNSGTNLLRLENDGFGNESTLRFRSKSSSGAALHADISVFSTANNQGYLGIKVPANNSVNVGYDFVLNHVGNIGLGTLTPFLEPCFVSSRNKIKMIKCIE